MRKLCSKCEQKPVAINYYKESQVFYRTLCDTCSKKRSPGMPAWRRSGYKIKLICDRCNFSSKHQEQFNVFHIDGDLLNVRHSNLKTVCANCQRILNKENIRWKKSTIIPDL